MNLKHFHYLCDACIKVATKCSKCNKTVVPKSGNYSCCGVTETVERVNYVSEYNQRQITKALSPIFSGIYEKYGMEHFETEVMNIYDEDNIDYLSTGDE